MSYLILEGKAPSCLGTALKSSQEIITKHHRNMSQIFSGDSINGLQSRLNLAHLLYSFLLCFHILLSNSYATIPPTVAPGSKTNRSSNHKTYLRHLATQGYQTKRLKQLLLRNHMAFVVNLLRVDSSSKE